MSRVEESARDAIDHAASGWIVRLGEGHLSPEEARAFRQWRAADQRHEQTFTAMRRTWGEITALGDLAGLASVPDDLDRGAAQPRRTRRSPIKAIGALAAALLALLLVPAFLQRSGQHYQTALAQTHRLVLPDGSVVTLGARSAIDVNFSDAERRVTLTGGEAFFEVAHDAQHPFLVLAGTSIIRDVGTKYNINLGDGSMRVSVLEGAVNVTGSDGRPPKLLRAGEAAEVRPATVTPIPIVALTAQAPGAWREDRLVYENVRLADLVADVNRYYAPGVQLETKAIGDLRITASFKTGEIPAFMTALGATLPVRAAEAPDGAFRVQSIEG